ncbi:MAG: acyl-CoA dehydrogenase family protein [Acidimicrobiales bacterium]
MEPPDAEGVVAAAQQLADELLWPASTEVDQASRIPLGHFKAIAELGLYGMVVPVEAGGLGFNPPTVRRILRILASGCGATSFAFAQHHGTVASVAATDNRGLADRRLPGLIDDRLAGIAYAHMRRPGPPVLTATPDGDGWTFDGVAPWVTSWGTAEVMAVAAATDDGRLVWALVPAVEGGGLAEAGTFDLMVFGATQTVALSFDRFAVGPELVLDVVDRDRWADGDRFLAARPNPLCLGISDRAMRQLAVAAPELAAELEPWWQAVGDRAEQQAGAVDDRSAELGQVAAARAEVLMAVQRLTTAPLAATGGGAMERSHPGQRLSREALFYVIQAQSADGRAAVFEHLIAGR